MSTTNIKVFVIAFADQGDLQPESDIKFGDKFKLQSPG